MIKIYDKIEVKPIDTIKPYWRNPRKNDKTVEALVKVIPEVGFNVPIYIDNDNVIIKGHARYRAAVKLGMDKLPCIVSTNMEEQNRLDRIADNKVSELSEWNMGDLRYELENIDFDIEAIGFDIPKDNFFENTYPQEEYGNVSNEDFTKAYNKIVDNIPTEKKDIIEQFEKPTENNNISPMEEDKRCITITCPRCGEKFITYLKNIIRPPA